MTMTFRPDAAGTYGAIQIAGTDQLKVDNSGSLTFGGNFTGGTPFMLRNRLINGDMRIWQRGTSFSNPGTYLNAYCADRWQFYRSSFTTNISATQQTGVQVGSILGQTTLRVQRTATDTSTAIIYAQQQLESVNCADLAGQTITISAWVKVGANLSANMVMGLSSGTGVDENSTSGFTGAVTVNTVTIPSTTTSYTKFTLTGTLASNVSELRLQFVYQPTATAAGVNDWFEIAMIQLELGSVATPFERRPYPYELMLCMRYYYAINATSANQRLSGCGQGFGTAASVFGFYHPVPMRIPPTPAFVNASNMLLYNGTGTTPVTTASLDANSITMSTMVVNAGAGTTTSGTSLHLTATSPLTSNFPAVSWSAEL